MQNFKRNHTFGFLSLLKKEIIFFIKNQNETFFPPSLLETTIRNFLFIKGELQNQTRIEIWDLVRNCTFASLSGMGTFRVGLFELYFLPCSFRNKPAT